MQRVLIVKLSSMGDLVHALPALSDAVKAIPELHFDWVVDEAFSDLPSWHNGVDLIIESAHRRWRKQIYQSLKTREIQTFYQQLRARHYDKIIDAQSSHKSALVTRLARGRRYGFDRQSVREKGAEWAYQQRLNITFHQHAIPRIRQLFAQTLNYTFDDTVIDYGIRRDLISLLPIELPKQYIVLVAHSSWPSKSWPLTYWQQLIQLLAVQGITAVLPWGTKAERRHAEQIASDNPQTLVLPKLSLSQFITVGRGAIAGACVDTGLGHVLAALEIPTVSLYGPTDSKLSGTLGISQIHLHPLENCSCFYQKVCRHNRADNVPARCLAQITPAQVWQALQRIIE